MADPLTSIGIIIISIFEVIIHNVIGLAIVGILGFMVYTYFFKPKPVNMGREVFNKQWEATAERLKLKYPKKLAICTYPMSLEELKGESIHRLKYDLIGDIIGINVVGVKTSAQTLVNLADKVDKKTYQKMLDENMDEIKNDKFWIVLAYSRKTSGLIFKKVKRAMLYLKPSQIINFDSVDNIIRVRGYGLEPLGEYEIVNDESIGLTRNQLMMDTATVISQEIVLGAYNAQGEIVEKAMRSNSSFRMDTALEGLKALNPPKEGVNDD